MPHRHDAAPTSWEFCATVEETRTLLSFALQIGVELQLTSVRIDPDGAHGPCSERLVHQPGAKIDGYIVDISCDSSPEAASLLQRAIEATIQGCLVLGR